MQISVTGHHVEVTASMRDYVTGKMARLERHFDHVSNIHVILSLEKLVKKAEATLNISGAQLYADASHEDMYAAIDALIDKLDRQILKHKEKLKNHKRNNKEPRVVET